MTKRLVALGFLAILTGCGSSGPGMYPVTGNVTFDGQPVARGQIVFRAADDSLASCAGEIVAGRYAFDSSPGPKRVEITATRGVQVTAQADSGEPALNFEVYIPEKYNTQSELLAAVSAEGKNEFDFTLEP